MAHIDKAAPGDEQRARDDDVGAAEVGLAAPVAYRPSEGTTRSACAAGIGPSASAIASDSHDAPARNERTPRDRHLPRECGGSAVAEP